MLEGKKIFYSALDWGLGHATRSVPVIKELQKKNEIILGVTPITRLIFDVEFPELKKINVPAYDITYSTVFPLWMKLLVDSSRIKKIIIEEHNQLEKIISENKIDVVISDNRFGMWSKKVQSVFITHQLNLKTPVFNSWAIKMNLNFIEQFSEVWVPDFEESEKCLAGELSRNSNLKIPVEYIGPQSSLEGADRNDEKINSDILIILSGPEPQRTILEKKLLNKISTSDKKIILVRGTSKSKKISQKNIQVFDFCNSAQLKKLILGAEKIICRSGYSTLMDMHTLGKKNMILIPTPGQTEQEYLADHWETKFRMKKLNQNNLGEAILLRLLHFTFIYIFARN